MILRSARRLPVALVAAIVAATMVGEWAGPRAAEPAAGVLDTRALIARETFWDNRDADWFADHIPAFECPDADIQTTWYYRWELITKHLTYGSPNTGYLFTEFLDRPFWSGAYGAISCPAGHQLYEVRWLRKPRIARDYCRYWLETKGAQPRNYSTWLADSIWAVHLVHPAAPWLDPSRARPPGDVFPTDLLAGLEENTAAWRKRHYVDAQKLFWQVGHGDGMEFNIASRQTKDILRGAPSYRPSFNAYQWADLHGLANLHELAGENARAAAHRAEADRIRERMEEMLWDDRREFFLIAFRDDETANGHTVKANTRIYDSGQFAGSDHGRELVGYVPWQFDMPTRGKGYERAWKFLMDANFFFADFGPTTTERHDPLFLLQKGCCWWSGQSWPYATTQTLKALANVLQRRTQDVVTRADYLKLLGIYARTHRKDGRPYLAEACHPDTGSFAGHDAYNHSEHYFHSGYTDLVITGLMGVVPRNDDVLEVRPLLPDDWDYCALDHLTYRGRQVAVVWDRTGSRYGLGRGLHLVADGTVIATAPKVGPLQGTLPPVSGDALGRLAAAGFVDDGLRPGLAPVRVNFAVNNDGTYFPRLTVSSIAEGSSPRMLADGEAWYLRSPPNRWAAAEPADTHATIEVDFGVARRIDEVRLFVLDDDPEALAGTADVMVPGRDKTPSPVRVPREIVLESWNGGSWGPVAVTRRVPAAPAGHRANVLSFAPLETTKLRVRLVPQSGFQTGLSEVEAWGEAKLPVEAAPPPAGNIAFNPGGKDAPPFPKATASHTSRFDRVDKAIDGIVSFTPTPANRWTSFESPNAADWLEIDLGATKRVGRVELAIFDDRGGVQAPESYLVEVWDGAAWRKPEAERRSPEIPAGGIMNTVTFKPLDTAKLRVTFTHRGKARSGVSEVFVWEE
jgi:hypothetical protein